MKNLCSGCGRNFGGVRAHEVHRVGSFSKNARRCMTVESMSSKGLFQNKDGSWCLPVSNKAMLAWHGESEKVA